MNKKVSLNSLKTPLFLFFFFSGFFFSKYLIDFNILTFHLHNTTTSQTQAGSSSKYSHRNLKLDVLN